MACLHGADTHASGAGIDQDAAISIAESTPQEVALFLHELNGHVRIDTAAASIGDDLGAELGWDTDGDSTGASVELGGAHVAQEAEANGAAAGIELEVTRPNTIGANAAGAGGDAKLGRLDARDVDA